jgi:hypothetical protein
MTALLLSDPLNGGFRAELAHARRNHDPFAALRGEQQVPAGIEYKWKMGRKQPGKLVWTDGMELLACSALLDVLRPFSGWHSVPIVLALPSNGKVDGYERVVVTGRCGRFMPERSIKIPAGGQRQWDLYKGLCFAEGTPRADICVPREQLHFVFVSEPYAEAIRAIASDDATLTPCDEVLQQPRTYLAIMEKTVGYRND